MRASDRAYVTLREEIVDGDLLPGALLGEVEQSMRLGISRTPLREALSRLIADGLAEPSRGRGIVVSAVSLDEAPHLFDLRIALETLAARRAAERAAEPDDGAALRESFATLAIRFDEATADLAAATTTVHLHQALAHLRGPVEDHPASAPTSSSTSTTQETAS